MPPRVIDLRQTEDTRDVVHVAVQALTEGKIVALPTETVYVLAVGGLNAPAVSRLRELCGSDAKLPLTLAVKSADEALDYVPNLSPVGRRMARRCWPGPVMLVVVDRHPEGLIKQLPPETQRAVEWDGAVALRVPAHQIVQDILRLLTGPIVMAGAGVGGNRYAVTAQEVIQSHGEHVQLVLDDGRSRFGQPSSVVRVRESKFEIVRPGVVSEQTLRRLASAMVLFVCTGNTCRSPMAETLFRRRLAERLKCPADKVEEKGYVIMSAGIAAMMGGRASPEAVTVMKEYDSCLKNHESQPLTDSLVRNADLVLAMTRSHRHAILTEWPEAAPRVHMLCRSGSDVIDPIGGPVEGYRRCAAQIDAELDYWVDVILEGSMSQVDDK